MSNISHEFQIPNTPYNNDSQKLIVSDSDMFAKLDAHESNEKNKLDYIEQIRCFGSEIITARENKIQTGDHIYDDRLSAAARSLSRTLFSEAVLSKHKIFQKYSRETLISMESEIGSDIFSNQPKENHIVFFLEDDNHWYFYQERNEKGKSMNSFTIHYEVRDEGILKISDITGIKGEYISGVELENFLYATTAYHGRVMSEIYGQNTESYSQKAA